MLRIEDALQIILDNTPLLGEEDIALTDAIGRLLRCDAVSDLDLPPFDRARMDGYALKAADAATASETSPARLREIGEAAAGHAFEGNVESGQAVRIMTGAPVPAGADGTRTRDLRRDRPAF